MLNTITDHKKAIEKLVSQNAKADLYTKYSIVAHALGLAAAFNRPLGRVCARANVSCIQKADTSRHSGLKWTKICDLNVGPLFLYTVVN